MCRHAPTYHTGLSHRHQKVEQEGELYLLVLHVQQDIICSCWPQCKQAEKVYVCAVVLLWLFCARRRGWISLWSRDQFFQWSQMFHSLYPRDFLNLPDSRMKPDEHRTINNALIWILFSEIHFFFCFSCKKKNHIDEDKCYKTVWCMRKKRLRIKQVLQGIIQPINPLHRKSDAWWCDQESWSGPERLVVTTWRQKHKNDY